MLLKQNVAKVYQSIERLELYIDSASVEDVEDRFNRDWDYIVEMVDGMNFVLDFAEHGAEDSVWLGLEELNLLGDFF